MMFTGRAATPPPEACSVADYGNSFNPEPRTSGKRRQDNSFVSRKRFLTPFSRFPTLKAAVEAMLQELDRNQADAT
jgi:hypothetical protein